EPDFGGDFDFGGAAGDQTVNFGAPPAGAVDLGGQAAAPADTMDFAAGGFGGAGAGGFRDTTEGPVFDLGVSADEETSTKPRQVFDLGEASGPTGFETAAPAQPFADTQFANAFDMT